MRKYIQITPEVRKILIEKYGRVRKSVWEALTFVTNSKAAISIREDAMQMGGIIMEEDFIPNCKTEHRDGTIIQTFAGGVRVVIDADSTRIIVGDSTIASYKDVTIESWGNVLARAEEISKRRVFNN